MRSYSIVSNRRLACRDQGLSCGQTLLHTEARGGQVPPTTSEGQRAMRAFERTTFASAYESIERFEEVLGRHGITIHPGAQLEHGCLVLKRLVDAYNTARVGGVVPDWEHQREDLQQGLGVWALAELIVEQSKHADFGQLVPHLRLLNNGTPAQTVRAQAGDDASNKILELRTALSCMRFGSDVRLDHPTSSSGKNPDVLARMADARLWGIACKAIHGDSPLSLFDRFVEGVEQIERSDADVGIVFVSFKNRIEHDYVFPTLGVNVAGEPVYGALHDHRHAKEHLANITACRVYDMVERVGRDAIARSTDGKKALPALCSPIDCVVAIRSESTTVPTILSFLHIIKLENPGHRRITHAECSVLGDMNDGLLAGRPHRGKA